MTDEEKVRAAWERAELCESRSRHAYSISLGGRGFTRASVPREEVESPERAWSAAAEFTAKQEQAIADVDEEIAEIREGVAASPRVMWDMEVIERIVARLEAHRAELARGMKEKA